MFLPGRILHGQRKPGGPQSMELRAMDDALRACLGLEIGVPSTGVSHPGPGGPLLAQTPSSPSPTQSCLETQGCSGSWDLHTSPRPEGNTTRYFKILACYFYFIMELWFFQCPGKTADSVYISIVCIFIFPVCVDYRRMLSRVPQSPVGLVYLFSLCVTVYVFIFTP